MTVSGPNAHRDLDSIPPRTASQGADINGDFLETTITADSSNVQLAVVTSSAGYADCKSAVFANGITQTDRLVTGDVLCVLTSEGRVARLVTTDATQTSTLPIVRFDVTVWDPPLSGTD